MNHLEWMKDTVENRLPEAVLQDEGVESAQAVWQAYNAIPATLLDDEPALKQHIAMLRIHYHDQARMDCTLSRLPAPEGYKHFIEDPNEIDDMNEAQFPPSIRLIWLFGWARITDVKWTLQIPEEG